MKKLTTEEIEDLFNDFANSRLEDGERAMDIIEFIAAIDHLINSNKKSTKGR